MIRRVLSDRLYQSLLGAVLVLLVALAYLFGGVLDRSLVSEPTQVTVRMDATGGLYEGSIVTYRGVKVGEVKQIRLAPEGVEATITLEEGARIPRDSPATVRMLSPVGEQYLDFQPRTAEGPYLSDGDVIRATSVDIPKRLAETVIAIQQLMDQIDGQKLDTLLTALNKGLRGTGDDLDQFLDSAEKILSTLERTWPETKQLLARGNQVLEIGIDNAEALRRLGTSSRRFAAFLREYDPELRRLLENAPAQLQRLESLVSDMTRRVPRFLRTGVALGEVFSSYEPHLRALLGVYAPGINALTSAIWNGEAHLQIVLQHAKRCDYGTQRRKPRELDDRPFPRGGHCPASFPTVQRGAAHVPGPVE